MDNLTWYCSRSYLKSGLEYVYSIDLRLRTFLEILVTTIRKSNALSSNEFIKVSKSSKEFPRVLRSCLQFFKDCSSGFFNWTLLTSFVTTIRKFNSWVSDSTSSQKSNQNTIKLQLKYNLNTTKIQLKYN